MLNMGDFSFSYINLINKQLLIYHLFIFDKMT